MEHWPTKRYSVSSLHLDPRNPRLGRERTAQAPREIIQYLFDNDKAMEVAQSIATRGFFPNEPLLAVKENGQLVVVEGNRRLAALKALREPGLLEGAVSRQVARLSRLASGDDLTAVPVTIAPSRRATDRQVAGRHGGSPVLAWQAENRASFILDKLEEGYDNDQLREELGFSTADIQKARQTRAIADMARSLELPEELAAKLTAPRTKIFTTVERVFDSSSGRKFLFVKPDPDHGIKGLTTKNEFLRGFKRLITDIALGSESSRTLNKNENIEEYFEKWPESDRPVAKRGSFVPSDIIKGKSVASPPNNKPDKAKPKPQGRPSQTVLPKDFKVVFGSVRLKDIRTELTKLKREDFPNAGAVLLRVFLELAVIDYLDRADELEPLIVRLKSKNAQVPFGVPSMKQLVPEISRIAKARLKTHEADKVNKALKYDAEAPFSLSDLHAFVHQNADLPSGRDILQFWLRTEPLFRLMLEQEPTTDRK